MRACFESNGALARGHVMGPTTIIVRATWDAEAGVWAAESINLPEGFGLVTVAPTLDALEAKLPVMIQDLLKTGTAPAIEIVIKVRDHAIA
jgi:hypothetical protein